MAVLHTTTRIELRALYTSSFLFAFHVALLAYIESSFLSAFIPEQYIGLVFTAGAIFATVALVWMPAVLSKIGNFRTIFLLAAIEIIALIVLAAAKTAPLAVTTFIVHAALYPLILFGFDIFLEHDSPNTSTGNIRGIFLTASNAAWIVPPLLTGLILQNGDYWKIFAISALLMFPILMLFMRRFSNFRDPIYNRPPFWKTLREIAARKNIFRIFMSNGILMLFFAWMTIFTPLYLHNHLAFPWSTIGMMFAVMLIPFVLVDIPLGRLADRFLGEKEMLSAGFIIGAVSTGVLAFLPANAVLWTIVLFVTRIGMATVQIMNESYFFKQVNDIDANIISMFRNTQPIAYIIAPLLGTVVLWLFEFRFLFLVLACITLFGLRYSLTLKDTK
ncbi:MAG: hypothetical protein COW88_02405 [Candidatus Lloydbacteria bacterium CG22_combo_CG10-13_8_21_14_all_47_15]|uniref:Major facilitator superfamily (MFS) profile domain-containing protein n=1 Tax=Candidatus Lloydbacteria bacterium CG22_combo_CG10-13_8_21_14_all_47_15 TaxID=1974635 RepID=A0A2H0CU67_9BACT|nr:MAG: hypothetical protein COW88_02405 [Candidatus Lloydbacteria bacterium CG22_combo_CG10-13_8_21_14_all_47_15]